MRRLALGLVLFLLTAFGVGEAVILLFRVEPRVVIVRPSTTSPVVRFVPRHGRITWEQVEQRGPSAPTRKAERCTTPPHVQFYGDSIAFGAGLKAEESLGARLQAALDADGGAPLCVHNHAQPAATLHPQLAVAEDEIPAQAPALVLVQLWYGSPRVPVLLGDAAYYLDGLATDDAGYPTFAFGLSGPLHHALFNASRFWAWSTFAVNPGCKGCSPSWDALVSGDLTRLHTLTTAHGGRLAVLLAPPLDRPIEALRAEPVDWYDPVITWAGAHGVPVLRLEDLLEGQDIEVVRKNTCCHYNAVGTDVLGQALAPRVRSWLAP